MFIPEALRKLEGQLLGPGGMFEIESDVVLGEEQPLRYERGHP